MKSAVDECKYEFTDERIEKIMDFIEYVETDLDKKEDDNHKAGRPPDLKKYIEKNHVKNSTFKLDEYYSKFPNNKKHNDKFVKQISDMIKEKRLVQISDNEFRVN